MTTLDEILKIASIETGVPVADIVGASRDRHNFKARKLFVFLARNLGHSFPSIAREINRDHTTAMSAFDNAKKDQDIVRISERRLMRDGQVDSQKRKIKAHGRWAHIYELFGGKCYVCGFDEVVEVHHIVPRAIGGKDHPENLVLLCPNHHALADRGMIQIKDIPTKNEISTT